MRKLLILLLLFPMSCFAQTGAKHDQIRTPNGFNTIVDWNLKAKSFNLPHYLLTARPLTQDSIGTIFLNTNSADPHIYIKNLVGSTYNSLAFSSELPFFTNDFKRTVNLIGFADTLHRTSIPWTINATGSNPPLVINSTGSGNLQNWNMSGATLSYIAPDGQFTGQGLINPTPFASRVATSSAGAIISRGIADNQAVLRVQNYNYLSNGFLLTTENYYQRVLSVDYEGSILHNVSSTAVSGSANGYHLFGTLKPIANGDKLVGLQVEPFFGTSTIASYGSLVGGTGYPNGVQQAATVTGGTGHGAVFEVTVSGGVITSASLSNSGVNYTVGDVISLVILNNMGVPQGSGGTVTVTGVTTYTGVSQVAAWFKNAPIQLDQVVTPTIFQSGMMWQDGTHLYGYIGGGIRQLDQQIGVNSIFGRNGAVVAQSGDYNTSQVAENTNLYFTQARVLATPATGYSAAAGTISATDPLITVINKLSGNIAASVTGVSSVNGRGGAVTITTADVNAAAATVLGTVTAGSIPYTLLSGTVPTWNQNTTGSAAKWTTARNVNGVALDGTANITITANTPGTLTNSYGLLGSPFSGANQTWAVDTTRGKLVTTYGLIDTINAHGATSGYGINSTLFPTGTVAVDTTNVASKAWAFAAFYTKAQSASTFASLASPNSFTALNTFNQASLGTGFGDELIVGTAAAATGAATVQNSGNFRIRSNGWGTTAASSQNVDYYWNVQPTSSGVPFGSMNLYYQENGGTPLLVNTWDSGGGVTYYNKMSQNLNFIAGVSTDGFVLNNNAGASGANNLQKSTRIRQVGSVWTGSLTEYIGFTEELSGVSQANPTGEYDISGYIGTSSTPTFAKLSALDAATGNLTLATGNLITKGTPASINSTGTATAAQVAGGWITSTSAAATTITLPTATLMATQLQIATKGRFQFVLDNTAGANTVTISLGSGMTQLSVITGSNTLTVASGAIGIAKFELIFSSATACTISRIE